MMNMKEEFKQMVRDRKMTNKETMDILYEMMLETFDHVAEYTYDKAYDDGKNDRLPNKEDMRYKFWKKP